VLLDSDVTLLPGDFLAWAPSKGITSNLSSLGVCAPLVPAVPKVLLTCPKTLSACDATTLRAETTLSRCSLAWGCKNDTDLSSSRSAQTLGPSLIVNGSLLSVSKVYIIVIQVNLGILGFTYLS
jgi:hypothetical protein